MNIPGHSSDQFYGAMYEALPDMGELEASDDGLHYKKVCKLKPVYQGVSDKVQATYGNFSGGQKPLFQDSSA